MEDKEENNVNESKKKTRYKTKPELQVYDEFGYKSNDEYMKELERPKLQLKEKKNK